MLWDRWKEQLCLQPAGMGPYTSLELSPSIGRWVLASEPGQELGLGPYKSLELSPSKAGGSWPLNPGRGWGQV